MRQAEFPAIWSFEGLTASGEEMLQQKGFVPGDIRYLCSSTVDMQFLLYFDSSHVNTGISLRIFRVDLMAEEGELLLSLGS